MIRAVVFDVDGTLVDSVDQHAQSWQKALRESGFDFPLDKLRNEIGKGSDQYLETFLSKQDIAKHGETIAKRRGEIFKRDYLPRLKAFPRVRELFEKILSTGRETALATSAHGDELEAYLDLLKIRDLLGAQTSKDDARKSKPEPDIFCAALARLDIPPSEAVVVGDSRYDAQAAIKAGATPIGVLCGGFGEQDLRENGFVEIYRDPEDLLQRLDSSLLAKMP